MIDEALVANLVRSTIGGALIGAAAGGFILVSGRIAGISGILGAAVTGARAAWAWAFLAGLVLAVPVGLLLGAGPLAVHLQGGPWLLASAGLLVGIGTRLSSGCTSGHGVCGLSNLSPRSLTATAIFMGSAGLTAFIVHHLWK